jgi:hypothetical protein
MISHLGVLDLEKVFQSDPNAKVLDCYRNMVMSTTDAEDMIRELCQEGTSELNFVASCRCGHLTGNYYTDMKCPECKTVVATGFATDLRYKIWLEIPDIMPPIPHPSLYRILETWLGTNKLASGWTVDSLLSTALNRPVGDNVLGQGFVYFYENFDCIITHILSIKNKTALGRERSIDIPKFISMYRDRLFIRHMPILNSALHVLTSNRNSRQADSSISLVLKAFSDLTVAVHTFKRMTTTSDEMNECLFSVYKTMIKYYDEIIKNKLEQKEGLIRGNILGARLHCTARAVVAPNTTDIMADEVFIPWKMAVAQLKLEILNLLINRHNYTLPAALELYNISMVKYNKLIDDIIKTLIKECPYKGLPVQIGRNPK